MKYLCMIYFETKEQLGGFVFIEARDLDEAIDVAAKIPGLRIGCVEIRPVAYFDLGKQP
jgi:hypothetical protein